MLNILKTLHWATKKHCYHVALDEAYKDFGEKIDQFVEAYIGLKDVENLVVSPISYEIPQSDEEIYEYFRLNYKAFLKTVSINYSDSSGLDSMMDDFENIGNKLLYLLKMN